MKAGTAFLPSPFSDFLADLQNRIQDSIYFVLFEYFYFVILISSFLAILNFTTSMRVRNLAYDSFSHGHSAGDLPTVRAPGPS